MRQPEGRRIIVIDDEPSIADTLATIFRNSGYNAEAYYDGQSALDACMAGAPDLLVSDVTMPGLTGLDLAILVKELCPSCKVLLFSGLSTSFDLVERAKRQGHYFEILEKPIAPALLLEKVAAELSGDTLLPFPQPGLRAG